MLIGSEKDQASYLPKHGTFGLTVRIKDRIFSAIGLTWRQGQEECEKLGGYLAEIKSQEQQDFLASFN